MSGGVAHATLTVGSEELNLTAYESVVTLNPSHARLPRSGDRKGEYATEKGGMPRARARGLQGLDDRRVGSPGHRA